MGDDDGQRCDLLNSFSRTIGICDLDIDFRLTEPDFKAVSTTSYFLFSTVSLWDCSGSLSNQSLPLRHF